MQKLFFLALCPLFLAGNLVAQDTMRTLIRSAQIHSIGLYLAPEFQYGQSNGEFTPYAGGSFMLLFNKRLAIGVTAQHNVRETFSPKGVSPLVLRSAFGGVKLEYTSRPDAALHFSFPLVIGMGEACADSLWHHRGNMHGIFDDRPVRTGRDGSYLVIQPGVQLEANLIRYIKLFAGANYRITSSVGHASTLPSDALQGFSLSAGMKIGFFDLRLQHKKAGN